MYEIFKKLCEQKEVKPNDVAKATGVSAQTFTDWKHGKYEPKHEKLQKIADYFGVSVEYLNTGEEREGYYINQETAQAAQEIFENKELRMLFDTAKDAAPEDLQMVHQMLLALKRKERGES